MAESNGGASSSKAPAFDAQPKMNVRPPKQEDLQQSYATLVGTDPNPRGFYGFMGG